MNIIEQAAKRLEELQRAGVDVPWVATGFSGNAAPAGAPPPAAVHNIAAGRPTPASGFGNLPPRRSNEIELDLERLTRSGLIVPLLKNAALQGSAAIKRGNLIVVTSAMPGEGKTFTAVNLALSISMEVDHSVLLVDADVVRPSALRLLGVNAEHGLMDVLRDRRRDLSEVLLRPTNVPKLTLLPAGSGMLNSTELLASASMESLLDELATTYADRIVIFDAPPLMVTTESRVLAARAGQVVMVVESMHTPRNTISEAFATLSACPVVLSVLNKYTGPTKVGSYGYGY
jgi:protein-tyrosine kinase